MGSRKTKQTPQQRQQKNLQKLSERIVPEYAGVKITLNEHLPQSDVVPNFLHEKPPSNFKSTVVKES